MASITAGLLSTGRYSDLLIKCKGKEFKVHRAIVCTQSKPLAAAIDGAFKEASTGEIDLDGNEPDIVGCLLQFLYTQDYSDGREVVPVVTAPTPTTSTPRSTKESKHHQPFLAAGLEGVSVIKGDLLMNTKVYIMGDQLQIPDMKALAKKKYEEVVSAGWNSSSFVASLKLLYEETTENDRPLKDVAVKKAGEHVKDLCDRGDFIALLKGNGEIAFDILKASMTATPSSEACPSCGLLPSVRPQRNYSYKDQFCDLCGESIY